ncbi:hypothetical protein HEP87_59755 [Streptomyces sp. S1D4-11]
MVRNRSATSSEPAGSSALTSGRAVMPFHHPVLVTAPTTDRTPSRSRPYARTTSPSAPDSLPVRPDSHSPYQLRYSSP